MLGRTCSPQARPSAPKKALLWRTIARKAVPWRPEEAHQRHSKNIPESVCHHARLLGTNRHGQGQVAFLHAQRLQDMRGPLQQSKRGKQGKPEPAILNMTSPSSPAPTANVPSVHGLALSAICALTRSSPNYHQMTRRTNMKKEYLISPIF